MASDRQKVEVKSVEAVKPATMYETKSILGSKEEGAGGIGG